MLFSSLAERCRVYSGTVEAGLRYLQKMPTQSLILVAPSFACV